MHTFRKVSATDPFHPIYKGLCLQFLPQMNKNATYDEDAEEIGKQIDGRGDWK